MYLLSFGFAGSLLLHWPFSGCSDWGLLSSCSAQASYYSGFSRQSTALKHAGFSSAAPELSCPRAYGVFLDQESNPCLVHWQGDSQPRDHQVSLEVPTF